MIFRWNVYPILYYSFWFKWSLSLNENEYHIEYDWVTLIIFYWQERKIIIIRIIGGEFILSLFFMRMLLNITDKSVTKSFFYDN